MDAAAFRGYRLRSMGTLIGTLRVLIPSSLNHDRADEACRRLRHLLTNELKIASTLR